MKPRPMLFVFLLMALSCQKHEIRLPEEEVLKSEALKPGAGYKSDSLHGYLTALLYYNFTPSAPKSVFNYFAFFGDPARNLLSNYNRFENFTYNVPEEDKSNLKMGNVYFNEAALTWIQGNGHYNYYQQSYLKPKVIPEWKVQGNRTFSGFKVFLDRNFPVIKDSSAISSYSLSSKNLSIDLSKYFDNADSLMVRIWNNNGYYMPVIKRITYKDAPVANFSDVELSNLQSGQSYNISLKAFNYSHFMQDNKRYIFELGVAFERIFYVSN